MREFFEDAFGAIIDWKSDYISGVFEGIERINYCGATAEEPWFQELVGETVDSCMRFNWQGCSKGWHDTIRIFHAENERCGFMLSLQDMEFMGPWMLSGIVFDNFTNNWDQVLSLSLGELVQIALNRPEEAGIRHGKKIATLFQMEDEGFNADDDVFWCEGDE